MSLRLGLRGRRRDHRHADDANCTISGNFADLGGGLSNFDVATMSFATSRA